MATSATRPMVRPTAPPVLSPPLFLFFVIPTALPEVGGTVGVTVTVRICPVTVSSEVMGVGVHVDDELPATGVSDFEKVVIGVVEELVVEDEELVELGELSAVDKDVVGVSTTVTALGVAVTVT